MPKSRKAGRRHKARARQPPARRSRKAGTKARHRPARSSLRASRRKAARIHVSRKMKARQKPRKRAVRKAAGKAHSRIKAHERPHKKARRIVRHARAPERRRPPAKPAREKAAHAKALKRHAAAPKAVKRPAEKGRPGNVDFLLRVRGEIADAVSMGSGLPREEMLRLLERPPEGIEADFALPCFMLSKRLGKAPQLIAMDLSGKVSPGGLIKEIRQAGPYLNFLVDWSSLASEMVPAIISLGRGYGSSSAGRGKTVVVDFSSPNTAKPMGVGHLRSTIIGDSLCRIHRFLGYRVIGDNHLGDWGTQFGKIIVAYRKWGREQRLEEDPLGELYRIYVKFHEEAETDKGLEDEARQAFKRLEAGDMESLALWKRFTELSNREFGKTYKALGVRFDSWLGESFYIPMAKEVIGEAVKKGAAKWSQHALVIDTGGEVPLIIRKSDEATLYSTRDLATIKFRLGEFSPERMLYVIGSEQKSYLQQVFEAAQRLGYLRPEDRGRLVHVPFGMVSLPEGKMSTRKGRVVLLDHVIKEVTDLAEKTIIIKNPGLKDRQKVARQVGVGAIKYADLSRDRIKDIRFDWNEMLSFEGDTGPYLQYTHARASSILRKAKLKAPPEKVGAAMLTDPKEKAIIRKLAEFPENVSRAAHDCKPHYIAGYVFSLATAFNDFYQSVPVLRAEGGLRSARLALVMAARQVLENGLHLLGIEAPEEM